MNSKTRLQLQQRLETDEHFRAGPFKLYIEELELACAFARCRPDAMNFLIDVTLDALCEVEK